MAESEAVRLQLTAEILVPPTTAKVGQTIVVEAVDAAGRPIKWKAVDPSTGPAGKDGEDGAPGKDGTDGYSPTVAVTTITGGHRISITDKNGTKHVDVLDGEDGAAGKDGAAGSPGKDGSPGAAGADGEDGYSPTVAVTPITGGHQVAITDKNGTKYFEVLNGSDGAAGKDGAAGSPGKDGAAGKDGEDGADGVGIQDIALTNSSTSGNTYRITLTNGSTYSFTAPAGPAGKDGEDGSPGQAGSPGKDGVSPTVDDYGSDDDYTTVAFSDGAVIQIPNGVGIKNIRAKTATSAGTPFDIELTNGQTYTVTAPAGPTGKTGGDGVGITNIKFYKASADGNVYSVYLSDGSEYEITAPAGPAGQDGAPGSPGADGADGVDGKDGSPGQDGSDGITPHIGDNGNWYIGSTDTGEPSRGADGEPGKDGISATHSWNGTILTVTSASGTSSADLKGEKGDKGERGETGETGPTGADGYTPVRGVDYWTDADKADMVNNVLAALPAAEGSTF